MLTFIETLIIRDLEHVKNYGFLTLKGRDLVDRYELPLKELNDLEVEHIRVVRILLYLQLVESDILIQKN